MNKEMGMSAWHLTMLALGTVVGGSFFLGSAIAIKAAGPAIFIAFALGGLLVYFILTALSEMTVSNPNSGSFRTYSEQEFGSGVGFVVGWVYWTGIMLAMSSEATAASVFLHNWIPGFSLPQIAVAIVITVTLANLLGAKMLSNLESGLAVIKLAALIGFIVFAWIIITGIFPGQPAIGAGSLKDAPFFPHGISGLAGSMLIVLFCYAGFEVIGLAASEAHDPHQTIPRAIRYTVIALVGLYMAVIGSLLPLVPTSVLTSSTSPMIMALNNRGLGIASDYINIIMLTAIISTMLAATFGLARMMRSLAESGQAFRYLIDRTDVPYKGIIFSGVSMLLAVSLAYFVPERVYIFLVSSGGFSLLFAYLIIMLTHYRFRLKHGCPPTGKCQMWGFPYTSWATIISLIAIIVTMPLIPGQGSGLVAGLVLVAFFGLTYYLRKSAISRPEVAVSPSRKPILNKKTDK